MTWKFDSGNAGLIDDGIESRLRARNAAAGKDGYIYQGDLQILRWARDLWMYQYPVDSWVQRASVTGEKGERRAGGGWSPIISAALGSEMYSIPGINKNNLLIYQGNSDTWIKGSGARYWKFAFGSQVYKERLFVFTHTGIGQDGQGRMYSTAKGKPWKEEPRPFIGFPLTEVASAHIQHKGYYFGGLRDNKGDPEIPTKVNREYDAITN